MPTNQLIKQPFQFKRKTNFHLQSIKQAYNNELQVKVAKCQGIQKYSLSVDPNHRPYFETQLQEYGSIEKPTNVDTESEIGNKIVKSTTSDYSVISKTAQVYDTSKLFTKKISCTHLLWNLESREQCVKLLLNSQFQLWIFLYIYIYFWPAVHFPASICFNCDSSFCLKCGVDPPSFFSLKKCVSNSFCVTVQSSLWHEKLSKTYTILLLKIYLLLLVLTT